MLFFQNFADRQFSFIKISHQVRFQNKNTNETKEYFVF